MNDNIKLRLQLRHWTNLFIFLLTVVGNELSNTYGDILMYTAMAIWLEQTMLVKLEHETLKFIRSKISEHEL